MNRLVLTGMMGTGKSTVGPLLAHRLRMEFADSDLEVERRAGLPVAALIAAEGEESFRAAEREVVAALLERDDTVLALGGGALLDEGSRRLAEARADVVSLTCGLPELLGRVATVERPLLGGGDPRARLEGLLAERAWLYARYPGVDTTGRSPEAVAEHLAVLHRGLRGDAGPDQGVRRAPTSAGATRLHFGPAAASLPGAVSDAAGGSVPTSVALIADASLPASVVDPLRHALAGSELRVVELPVAGGEPAKRLETAAAQYSRLLAAGVDRGGVVVGVGGGVVTDLAGFVASTYLRGLPLVLVPSTLLAQVDAAVGGKTAVDLETAKNAVGTLHPAHCVLLDPELLRSLSERELRNGLAEMVKLGVILDAGLLTELEALDAPAAVLGRPDLVERSARVKLAVVGRDPHDLGERLLLNFGHTLGHALETVSGYAIPHGEAVAQGMVVATRIAVELGRCPPDLLVRLCGLLTRLGLPAVLTAVDVERLLEVIGHDKKRLGTQQRFVLPTGAGSGVVEAVPHAAVRAALHASSGARQ